VSQQLGALQTHTTDTFLFISHTTNVVLFKFRCNIFIGVRIIKEMQSSVASGTPCTSPSVCVCLSIHQLNDYKMYTPITVICTMGTGSFPRVNSGRGVTLTPHPLLVPWSRKGRAIPLPLWAVRPVHSLSACARV